MDTKKQSSFIEIVKSRFAKKGLRKDYLVVALLFGVLLLVIAMPAEEFKITEKSSVTAVPEETGEDQAASVTDRQSYEKQLEHRLEDFLGQVDGVGRVQVLIRLKDAGEQVVEKDVPVRNSSRTDAGEGSTEEEENREETTVFEETGDGRQIPYVIKTYTPEISGVVVAAAGAGNPAVEQEILEAVQALLQIEVHKIKVLKLKEMEGLY